MDAQLPPDNIIARLVVAVNMDIADRHFLVFNDIEDHIHRVLTDGKFHRINLGVEVAIIHVDGVHPLGHCNFKGLLAVEIAALKSKGGCQPVIIVQNVAFPGNIAVIVGQAFLDSDGETHPFAAGQDGHRILNDPGITVALVAVVDDEGGQVSFILVAVEGRPPKGVPFPRLGLFHLEPQDDVPHSVITLKFDLPQFDFLMLHDGNLQDAAMRFITGLQRGVDLYVEVPVFVVGVPDLAHGLRDSVIR